MYDYVEHVFTVPCSPLDKKSVMEASMYPTPIERVYDEACEVKNQALEATAYEVPVTLKYTDMVCICCMVRACVCVCVRARACVCVCVCVMYGLCVCT